MGNHRAPAVSAAAPFASSSQKLKRKRLHSGATALAVHLQTPLELCKTRVQSRSGHPTLGPGADSMAVVDRFARLLTAPSTSEGFAGIIEARGEDGVQRAAWSLACRLTGAEDTSPAPEPEPEPAAVEAMGDTPLADEDTAELRFDTISCKAGDALHTAFLTEFGSSSCHAATHLLKAVQRKQLQLRFHGTTVPMGPDDKRRLYLIMAAGHVDAILEKLGSSCGMPRGYPIVWLPGQFIHSFGFVSATVWHCGVVCLTQTATANRSPSSRMTRGRRFIRRPGGCRAWRRKDGDAFSICRAFRLANLDSIAIAGSRSGQDFLAICWW